MNENVKGIVSKEEAARMDKEEYAEIMKKGWNYGYDPEGDMAYEGEEKYCK